MEIKNDFLNTAYKIPYQYDVTEEEISIALMKFIQFYEHKQFLLPDNYLDMYSQKNVLEGIKYLDIKEANEIFDILKSCKENRIYMRQMADENKKRAEFVNRFAIPRGLEKKEYKIILKDTQDKINDLLKQERTENDLHTKMFLGLEREDYITKKTKLKKIIEFSNKGDGEMNIAKAKAYPIEQLIEFNSGGFAKCLWHEERTASLKWYKDRNKCHCFAGCGDFDSIDAYQKINNVDFNKAVKALS